MGKCIYYDKELNICKLHSDWSEAMPVLQPCIDGACDKECKDYKPLINYDRIRNMSIDEMASKIGSCCSKHICPCFERCHARTADECRKNIKEWLESEVE